VFYFHSFWFGFVSFLLIFKISGTLVASVIIFISVTDRWRLYDNLVTSVVAGPPAEFWIWQTLAAGFSIRQLTGLE
jgi:hypothetical protein